MADATKVTSVIVPEVFAPYVFDYMTPQEEQQIKFMPDALAKVYFHCVQCNAKVANVKYVGWGWKWSYILRCHNIVENVEVKESDAKNATLEAPLVVQAFKEYVKPTNDGRPNVMFHCGACDAITKTFDYQRDPQRFDHVFIVTCMGKKCDGEKKTVRYGEQVLKERDAWNSPTPIMLPINTKLLGRTVAKPPPQPTHTHVNRAIRKLRL